MHYFFTEFAMSMEPLYVKYYPTYRYTFSCSCSLSLSLSLIHTHTHIGEIGRTHRKTTVQVPHSQCTGTCFYLMAAVALVFAIVLALHNCYNVNPTVPAPDAHVHSNSYGGGSDKRNNFSHMNNRPAMPELSNLKRSGSQSPVKIMERIEGEKSSALGDILLNDEHGVRMKNIKHEERSVEAINREMFRQWLQGGGARVSWKALVDALDTVGLNTLADDIIDALSNQKG